MLIEFASVPFAGYAPDSGTPSVTAPGSMSGGTYVDQEVTSA